MNSSALKTASFPFASGWVRFTGFGFFGMEKNG